MNAGHPSALTRERARSVTILGSTGSVGTQTIELLAADPDRFQVRALVAGRNAALLAEQAIALSAEIAVVADPAAYRRPARRTRRHRNRGRGRRRCRRRRGCAAGRLDHGRDHRRRRPGPHPRRRSAAAPMSAWPTRRPWSAPATSCCARSQQAGATLLPVDSEHNAIFQSLADGNRGAVEKIVLTASGGPFRTATLEEMDARHAGGRACATRSGRWAPRSASIRRP